MISKYKSVLIWVQTQSVLIWVQTVCKGYQQMTKVDASKERVILAHRIRISEILPWDRKPYLTHAVT